MGIPLDALKIDGKVDFIKVDTNRGLWTRWLAARYEHVYAIEPNQDVLTSLKTDLPANVTEHHQREGTRPSA